MRFRVSCCCNLVIHISTCIYKSQKVCLMARVLGRRAHLLSESITYILGPNISLCHYLVPRLEIASAL